MTTRSDQPRTISELTCELTLDWRQRLRDQLAAAAERREGERALRARLAERRDVGLELRHAAKLGRRNVDRVSDQGPTTESQAATPSQGAATVAATTKQDRRHEVDTPISAQVAALARLRRAGRGGYRPTRPEADQ